MPHIGRNCNINIVPIYGDVHCNVIKELNFLDKLFWKSNRIVVTIRLDLQNVLKHRQLKLLLVWKLADSRSNSRCFTVHYKEPGQANFGCWRCGQLNARTLQTTATHVK